MPQFFQDGKAYWGGMHRELGLLCVFHGFLPPSPWECCHPRSVATLDRMRSLCALLLSMATAHRLHPVASRCRLGSRCAPNLAPCGAARRWAGLLRPLELNQSA
jgi:hypothetical protein